MNRLAKTWTPIKSVMSSAAIAALISVSSAYFSCRQSEAALAELEASRRRDLLSVKALIRGEHKDVYARAYRDCEIRRWLNDPCSRGQVRNISEVERDLWLLDLLTWIELVFEQTEGLEATKAEAWRKEALWYLQQPEICKRAKERLAGNEQYWEPVFWRAIPRECRGKTDLATKETATKVDLSTQLVEATKMKLRTAVSEMGKGDAPFPIPTPPPRMNVDVDARESAASRASSQE
jgi:hypothetical protein